MVGALSDLSTKAVIATLLWEFEYCRGVTDPLDTSNDTPTNMVLPLSPPFASPRFLSSFPNSTSIFSNSDPLSQLLNLPSFSHPSLKFLDFLLSIPSLRFPIPRFTQILISGHILRLLPN